MIVLGRPINDWVDIYALLVFRGGEPKSFKDLMVYRMPDSLEDCLKTGLELVEARQALKNHPVHDWAYRLLTGEHL